MPAARRPVGTITRGTTAPNRLRRIDRWLISGESARLLAGAADPLVVDLGYGASPVTTIELAARLARVRPDVEVVGLEIDPERVAAGRAMADALPAEAPAAVRRVRFDRGGFELGSLAGRRPVLVRAANVWRQYPVAEVEDGWRLVCSAMQPGGLLVDATCDEIGRRAAWVSVRARPDGGTGGGAGGAGAEPVSLSLSLRLAGLERPSVVAERLPKVQIHKNVPPEPVHAWLQALDSAWESAAPLTNFGVRQRFLQTCATVRADGWPVIDGPARWRLGEVSLAWSALA